MLNDKLISYKCQGGIVFNESVTGSGRPVSANVEPPTHHTWASHGSEHRTNANIINLWLTWTINYHIAHRLLSCSGLH